MKEIIVQNIIASLPVGLLVINPKGEMVTANGIASQLLGYPSEELLGRGWGELFLQNPANDGFNQVLLDVISRKEAQLRRAVPYVRPDGLCLRLFLTTSFVVDAGSVEGIVVLMQDLTELHTLHEREKEILRDKNRIQIERVESLRYLALGVAHQIRNPVMSIGGFALRLKRKLGEGTAEARYLQFILDGASRLEKIVEGVRSYAETPEPRYQTVAVDDVVLAAVDAFRKGVPESPGGVEWRLKLGSFEGRLDPGLFGSALTELLRNSVQALKEGRGVVSLSLERDAARGEWRLDIEDSGRGIAESDLPYVQDPFFTTRPDAVGLGLSRVWRIVADHRGSLAIKSRPGEGTRVTITIPEQAD